jgi:hypothetical protein
MDKHLETSLLARLNSAFQAMSAADQLAAVLFAESSVKQNLRHKRPKLQLASSVSRLAAAEGLDRDSTTLLNYFRGFDKSDKAYFLRLAEKCVERTYAPRPALRVVTGGRAC